MHEVTSATPRTHPNTPHDKNNKYVYTTRVYVYLDKTSTAVSWELAVSWCNKRKERAVKNCGENYITYKI